MGALFQRRCVVVVGAPPTALRIEGLRVAFKVEKDSGKHPNRAEIVVNNLSEFSRSGLQKKGLRVLLFAGYESTQAQIFDGDVRTIDHGRDDADWVTKITSGDGEHAYQHCRISESFGSGTKVSVVVEKLIKAMPEIDPGEALKIAREMEGEFLSGCAISGKASTELEKILRPRGYSWSIQDRRLQILKGDAAAGPGAILLSGSTGLIGSPEICPPPKKGGPPILKAKSLLQPLAKPGMQLQLDAVSHKGTYRILRVHHRGDTDGGDWYSEMEATPFA